MTGGPCMAGAPDSEGRGGCRAWDGRQPAECDGKALLCRWCLEGCERDVRALTLDYRDLEQLLPPALGVWGDGLPRGRSSPLPLREHILDLQLRIHWLTDAWGEVVRDRDRLSELASQVRQGWVVQQQVAVLAPRLRLLAELESVTMWSYPGHDGAVDVPGWQGVLDLAALHHRARSALGLTEPMPEVAWGVLCRGPCDMVSTLVRKPGEDEWRCRQCGEHYTAAAYTDWVGILAAAEQQRRVVA